MIRHNWFYLKAWYITTWYTSPILWPNMSKWDTLWEKSKMKFQLIVIFIILKKKLTPNALSYLFPSKVMDDKMIMADHTKYTQQNSYSISHLLGTVTAQWLPLWRCSHCSLVPNTVTTEQWLYTSDTHVIRYPLPWGLCRHLSTRHLVGSCTVTTWEDTRYPLYTVTV